MPHARRHPAGVHMRMVHPTLHVALPSPKPGSTSIHIARTLISQPHEGLQAYTREGITTKPPAAHNGRVAHVHSTSKTHSGVPCMRKQQCMLLAFCGLWGKRMQKIYSDHRACLLLQAYPTELAEDRRHVSACVCPAVTSSIHADMPSCSCPPSALQRSAAQPPDRCC